jgi:enoyl-CoA hydratase
MTLVRREERDTTVVLSLARPPINAINLELIKELHACLRHLDQNPPAGGVVLTGEGQAFSGGLDFKEVPTYTGTQRAGMISEINNAVTLLYGLGCATVAAVNGHAIGGALVLVLACDARLAAVTKAQLGLTEVTAGIPYPACPMEIVNAELEPGCRRRLVLNGETTDPQGAHELGIIDELLAPEELSERAIETARRRAAAPAYRRVKQQLRGDTLTRMRQSIDTPSDPMLEDWI